jgi:DNA polymerase-3 subunit delta'
MHAESANSLLKTLEEPPPKSLLILIGTSAHRQLATIVSRCQVIRFRPLAPEQVKQILTNQHLVDAGAGSGEPTIDELAAASGGSVQRALDLSEPATFEFRNHLLRQLASRDPGQNDFAKTLLAFVEAAGSEAADRRNRMHLIAEFAIDFYRQWIGQLTLVNVNTADQSIHSAARVATLPWMEAIAGGGNAIDWKNEGAEIAARCIQSCDDLQRQVAANVNAANAVDTWLRDLGRAGTCLIASPAH